MKRKQQAIDIDSPGLEVKRDDQSNQANKQHYKQHDEQYNEINELKEMKEHNQPASEYINAEPSKRSKLNLEFDPGSFHIADYLLTNKPHTNANSEYDFIIYGVYKTTNCAKFVYVGQTRQSLDKRRKQHLYADRGLFDKQYSQDTQSEFKFVVLEEFVGIQQQANDNEILHIKLKNTLYPNGFNLTHGGVGMIPNTNIIPGVRQKKYYQFKNEILQICSDYGFVGFPTNILLVPGQTNGRDFKIKLTLTHTTNKLKKLKTNSLFIGPLLFSNSHCMDRVRYALSYWTEYKALTSDSARCEKRNEHTLLVKQHRSKLSKKRMNDPVMKAKLSRGKHISTRSYHIQRFMRATGLEYLPPGISISYRINKSKSENTCGSIRLSRINKQNKKRFEYTISDDFVCSDVPEYMDIIQTQTDPSNIREQLRAVYNKSNTHKRVICKPVHLQPEPQRRFLQTLGRSYIHPDIKMYSRSGTLEFLITNQNTQQIKQVSIPDCFLNNDVNDYTKLLLTYKNNTELLKYKLDWIFLKSSSNPILQQKYKCMRDIGIDHLKTGIYFYINKNVLIGFKVLTITISTRKYRLTLPQCYDLALQVIRGKEAGLNITELYTFIRTRAPKQQRVLNAVTLQSNNEVYNTALNLTNGNSEDVERIRGISNIYTNHTNGRFELRYRDNGHLKTHTSPPYFNKLNQLKYLLMYFSNVSNKY